MAKKLSVFHFHNGSGGGVLTVIRNLLLYRQHAEIENHVIYTINKDKIADFQAPGLQGAATEQIFYYSAKWNFYHTVKQLAKLLPDEKSVIVAHDWLELGMASHLGLKNPVVFVLHGDYNYYYELALKHASNINLFVCIASSISKKIKEIIPDRTEVIYYQRFPVREPENKLLYSDISKVLFVGRFEKEKGFLLLPLIEQNLQILDIKLKWTIVGSGPEMKQVVWPESSDIEIISNASNEDVLKLLPHQDIILLPSFAEGMPVVIIEAMKAGVIPIVNDIPGGIQELVENGETGFKIKNNNPEEFAKTIMRIRNNLNLAKQLSLNCITHTVDLFNPEMNTKAFENLYLKACNNQKKKRIKVYGSRLDKPWIPNIVVKFLRR